MKKLIFAVTVLALSGNANAYGMAFLQSCTYGYNSDYSQSGYTGIYEHVSGNIYRYFFPANQYSWCPQTINF